MRAGAIQDCSVLKSRAINSESVGQGRTQNFSLGRGGGGGLILRL
jgi:hypothetical protein